MKTLYLATAAFVATMLTAFAGKLEVEKLEIDSLDFELPAPIRLRAEMAALQKPEFIASNKEVGLEALAADDYRVSLSSWAHVYRASDGLIFLTDNLHMALWVRDHAGWRCVVPHVRIDKTFGGAFPWLPVRYLGEGLFAISETVPGRVTEESDEGFPQARAVTFLIDSSDGTVKERSESFIYDHTPPVRVPENWRTKYKIRSEQAGAGQPATRSESDSEGGDKPQLESEGRTR